jgi:hypothetical protein
MWFAAVEGDRSGSQPCGTVRHEPAGATSPPRRRRLSIWSTPIFGGFKDKTDHPQPSPADAPMLHIHAVTVGG